MPIRLTVLALILVLLTFTAVRVGGILIGRWRAQPRPRRSQASVEWEPRRHQLYRQVKGVARPEEQREAILDFLETRRGVEAYVEPRTMMHPLSVVLVADDGEWRRFALADDSFVRELARTRSLPVYDAARQGYPERMRRYKRRDNPG